MNDGVDKIVADYLERVKVTLLTDDALWTRLLGRSLDAATIAVVRDSFRGAKEHVATPTVVLAYPRSRQPWPVWCVVLLEDTPDEELLGESEGIERDDETGEDVEVQTIVSRQTVAIMVIDNRNPDIARWQSMLVKRAMMMGLNEILSDEENSVSGMYFSGMGDMPPMPWLPEELYGRTQRWSFVVAESVASGYDGLVRGPLYVGAEGFVLDEDGEVTGGGHAYSTREDEE
jgi:hypothetical protein